MPPQQDFETGVPDHLQRVQAVVVVAGRDDLRVELPSGVQVVVVEVEPGLAQPHRLMRREHAEGHTRLKAGGLDRGDHLEDAVELRSVAHLSPGGAQTEAVGPVGLGGPGRLDDGLHTHQRLVVDAGGVVSRLGTVGAVLRAATGLDAQQRCALNLGRVVLAPMDLGRFEHQREQAPAVQVGDSLASQGVGGAHEQTSLPPDGRGEPRPLTLILSTSMWCSLPTWCPRTRAGCRRC